MIKFIRTILISYTFIIPSLYNWGVLKGTQEDVIISMLMGITLLIYYHE